MLGNGKQTNKQGLEARGWEGKEPWPLDDSGAEQP